MASAISQADLIASRLKGRQVSNVVADGLYRLQLHFVDGTILLLEAATDRLVATVEHADTKRPETDQPTKRQFEYLAFIAKYTAKFGRPPAEYDLQRHFLVSAPSVNQMMQTLERRNFITREPGVGRSVRINSELSM